MHAQEFARDVFFTNECLCAENSEKGSSNSNNKPSKSAKQGTNGYKNTVPVPKPRINSSPLRQKPRHDMHRLLESS